MVAQRTQASVAALASAGLRGSDVLGRYGGEEFFFVLPDTTLENAQVVADRIRSRIAATVLSGMPIGKRITVTIGIAELAANDTADNLVARADAALYRGKAAGRDRVATS